MHQCPGEIFTSHGIPLSLLLPLLCFMSLFICHKSINFAKETQQLIALHTACLRN